MNKPSPINQTTFRILYYRNKQFFVPIIILIACVVLVIEAILPQVQQWFSLRDQIARSQDRINAYNKNILVLQSISQEQLDSQLSFLTQVLPQTKDYIGILSAVSAAAINSGTKLGDYSFDVGDLSQGIPTSKSNSIELRLNVKGGVREARLFLTELQKQAPISDVADIQIGNNTVAILASFYFKVYPNLSIKGSDPILVLTPKEQDQFKTLQENIHASSSELSTPVSIGSF